VTVDPDELSVPYHRNMVASLKHCKGGMDCAMSRPMKICVLGLGGGLLTKFLYDNFKKVRIFDAQSGKIVKFDTVLHTLPGRDCPPSHVASIEPIVKDSYSLRVAKLS
jgi:hypothetical protein